jgi:hypothetical protein
MSSKDALLTLPQGYLRLRENSSRLWTCSEERFMHAVAAVKVLPKFRPSKRSNRRRSPITRAGDVADASKRPVHPSAAARSSPAR